MYVNVLLEHMNTQTVLNALNAVLAVLSVNKLLNVKYAKSDINKTMAFALWTALSEHTMQAINANSVQIIAVNAHELLTAKGVMEGTLCLLAHVLQSVPVPPSPQAKCASLVVVRVQLVPPTHTLATVVLLAIFSAMANVLLTVLLANTTMALSANFAVLHAKTVKIQQLIVSHADKVSILLTQHVLRNVPMWLSMANAQVSVLINTILMVRLVYPVRVTVKPAVHLTVV